MLQKLVTTGVLVAVLTAPVGAQGVQKVFVEDLDFSSLEIAAPVGQYAAHRARFELSANELAGMNDMFQQGLTRAIAKSDDYEVVTSADEADLVVHAQLLKLNPAAPKDDFKSRSAWTKYVSRGAGRATVRFVVNDHDLDLLDVETQREAGNTWRTNNRFNNNFFIIL